MSDGLMSTEAVAEYLDVPIATLHNWRYKKQGPPGFRVGRHIRYRREHVDAWLAERADDRAADVGA